MCQNSQLLGTSAVSLYGVGSLCLPEVTVCEWSSQEEEGLSWKARQAEASVLPWALHAVNLYFCLKSSGRTFPDSPSKDTELITNMPYLEFLHGIQPQFKCQFLLHVKPGPPGKRASPSLALVYLTCLSPHCPGLSLPTCSANYCLIR